MQDLTRSAAIHLYKKGRILEARQVLLECVRKDPHDVASWMWLVETIADTDERIATLRLCLKANPDNLDVKHALALLALQKNQGTPVSEIFPSKHETQDFLEPEGANREQYVSLQGGWIKEIKEEDFRDSGKRTGEIQAELTSPSIESIAPAQKSSLEMEAGFSEAELPQAEIQPLPACLPQAIQQKKQPAQELLPKPEKKQSIFVFLLKVIAILVMLGVLFSLVFVAWWVGTGHTTRDLVATMAPGAVYQVEVISTAVPTEVQSLKPTLPPTYTPEPTQAPSLTPAPTSDPALVLVIMDELQPGNQSPVAVVSSTNLLAYQASTNDLKVIELETRETLFAADVSARLLGLAFSQDGKRLAGVDENGMLTIWDTEKWTVVGNAQLTSDTGAILVEQMAFTPDGYGLLAGYCPASEGECLGNPSVVMLNIPDGRQRYVLAGVNRFTSGSGDLMAVWQSEKAQNLLKLVSQFSGDTIRYLQLPAAAQQENLNMAAFSLDTSQVAAATEQGSISVWDGLTGKLLAAWLSGVKDPQQILFVPDTSQILIGNSKSIGQVWDYGLQQQTSNFNLNANIGIFYLDSNGALRCVRAVSPVVEVWDVLELQSLESFSWENEKVISAIPVLNTRQIVLFSESGAVSIWHSEATR